MFLLAGCWWRTPLTPALVRQREAGLSELEVSLVYKVSFKTTRTVTQRNPVSKKKKKERRKKKKEKEKSFFLAQEKMA